MLFVLANPVCIDKEKFTLNLGLLRKRVSQPVFVLCFPPVLVGERKELAERTSEQKKISLHVAGENTD